jgi:hypothetical protein
MDHAVYFWKPLQNFAVDASFGIAWRSIFIDRLSILNPVMN